MAVQRRHTAFTIEQMIDAGIAEPIVKLYRSLLDQKTVSEPVPSAPGNDQLTGSASQLQTSVPDGETIRQELALRRGNDLQHREEIARYQKTIEQLRQEMALNSIKATGEINRREGRIEELQKAYAHLDQLRGQVQDRYDTTYQELTIKAKEVTDLRDRFTQTNQLLQTNSIRLTDLETRYVSLTDRLRKQLLEMKKLLRLLDQIEDAATLLKKSKRWKMANPYAALSAGLKGKALAGFGHLDKNVDKYRSWKKQHPEIDKLGDEIQSLRRREILSPNLPPPPAPAAAPASDSPPTPPPPSKPISFDKHEQVAVSIVIPVYGQLDFTLACLASVREHSGDISYEVIVVDDCSTDTTPDVVGQIPGLVYLRAESNAGFIASCNRGAEKARGKFLVFLNNDTTVREGWLSNLLQTFEREPNAGLVGSKLVYPDGRLQEAGGIIWRDGSGWNRGKFQDPSRPEFNYLREVSYCSAASVMIPKSLFEKLGGFDRQYAPAYYEDTDLAFKVAQAGLKVFYQPLSVVVHYEGITSGTDTASGVKQHQEINRHTFISTWAETLAGLPENGDIDSFNAPREGEKRILVIDHHLPMPDRDSGSLRMFNLLTILRRLSHQVTFLADNMADIPPYGDSLRQRGIAFPHHPYFDSVRTYLQREGANFDIVILSRCDFARKHMAAVRQFAPQSRVIFDTVDLHFLRESRLAQMTNDPADHRIAEEKRQFEYELIDQADETWVVSPIEKELIKADRPEASVELVSNIVDIPGSASPFSDRRDILFIGSFQHPPNTDAVLFFAREIFPIVLESLPQVRLYVIGDKAPPEIVALSSTAIVITGYQPDVSFYFNSIKLSVAPLRYGAGVKGKINQSMGFGVPVAATSLAVEGMGLTHGEDVMIGDDPRKFAAVIEQLYVSEILWNRVSRAALAKTNSTYSRHAAEEQLRRLFSAGEDRSEAASAVSPLLKESQSFTRG